MNWRPRALRRGGEIVVSAVGGLLVVLFLVVALLPTAWPRSDLDREAGSLATALGTRIVRHIRQGEVAQLRQALSGLPRARVSIADQSRLMALAIDSAQPEAVSALVDWGIDPNDEWRTAMVHDVTPLLYAVSARAHTSVVAMLLRRGALPDKAAGGLLPLHFALGLHQYDLADLLLSHGADPKAVEPGGQWTTLMKLALGAEDGHPAVTVLLDRLLRGGADINGRSARGATALVVAVLGGKGGLVRALLAAGADPNVRTDKGETLLQTARRKQVPDIEAALLAAGARD